MQQAASDSQCAELRTDTLTPIHVVTIQQSVSAMRPEILVVSPQDALDRLRKARDVIRLMDAASPLEAAYESVRRRLSALLRRFVGPADVEDILQEAFLRCYEADAATPIRRPQSYLYQTALNLARNHWSRTDRRASSSLDALLAEDEPASDVDIEREAVARERLALYCRMVAELPLQCRRAFLLKKVYGLSQREIAAYLGISENTVEKHVAKGLLVCATRMRELEATGDRSHQPGERQSHG